MGVVMGDLLLTGTYIQWKHGNQISWNNPVYQFNIWMIGRMIEVVCMSHGMIRVRYTGGGEFLVTWFAILPLQVSPPSRMASNHIGARGADMLLSVIPPW